MVWTSNTYCVTYQQIVREVVRAVSVPVTVKTRLGWNAQEINIIDFAPRSSLEYQLLNYLLELYNIERISVERVVSGPGITSIYRFLHDSNYSQSSPAMAEIYRAWLEEMGKPQKTVDLAAKIASFAQDNSDHLCYQTMKIFVEAYGAEAGNFR